MVDTGIPREGTTVELDKVVIEDNCLEDIEEGNPEEVDTEEGSIAAGGRAIVEVDSLEGGTEVAGSRLVELKCYQILTNLIVIKGKNFKIKDITIGILEESDMAIESQGLINWIVEVEKLVLVGEEVGGYEVAHFLDVHELVQH
jgi:hypothetical protein